MNFPATLLLIAALACAVFSWWGLNTESGRHAFDEMAGMIPLAAAPLGLGFAAGGALVWWRGRRNRGGGRGG